MTNLCNLYISFRYALPFQKLVFYTFLFVRFVRGEQYAVGLALLVEGKMVLGVMACPNLPLVSAVCETDNFSQENVGCLFFATTGSGTYVQPLKGNSPPQKVSLYLIQS